MNTFRVSLIGHRELDHAREVEKHLTEILEQLFRRRDFVEFQIGRNGEFDIFAASLIKRMQKHCGNEHTSLTLVLPYPVSDMEYYQTYYDNIFIPAESSTAHFKNAITKRNQWLIDHSDLLLAYVRRDHGGAAACLNMARKAGIGMIRI